MATEELVAKFFTLDSRLASFQAVHKRRASSASSKNPKVFSWPHKSLPVEELAKAGFYFNPAASNPDNVTCYLCHKSLDGWEDGDNALDEHLKHSAQCGWAIVAAIEADFADYAKENPADAHMVAARKATFADKWPHEGKKGWKCKTKQLVEAGWKYTPTRESDDMVTCAYCQLALDGWEPSDKPMDEHHNRAPDCQFFALNQTQTSKKAARTKGARASKASRLSVQSIVTLASEADSLPDHPAEPEDSVLTVTSMAGKKGGRAKKAATGAKGRKTKNKKEEPAEVPSSDAQSVDMPPPPPPPPPKAGRGRKRASDAMDDAPDSQGTVAEAPPPKKRATRGRTSQSVDTSVMDSQMDIDAAELPTLKKTAGRKKTTATKATRKASGASISSKASTASLRAAANFPDDDELDRQLEADLERALSAEDMQMLDIEPQWSKPATTASRPTTGDAAAQNSADYAMFAPAPAADEKAIDAELRALEDEMRVDEDEPLVVAKKGRKPGPRKFSKQTKEKKEEQPAPQAELVVAIEAERSIAPVEVEKTEPSTTKNDAPAPAPPKKRGRPPKSSKSSRTSHDEVSVVKETKPVAAVAHDIEVAIVQSSQPKAEPPRQSAAVRPPVQRALPLPPSPAPRRLPEPPSTPGSHISPAQSARQPVVSPSPSPQSSDAENQPPSSRATASVRGKRVALAPITATPARGASPSKRNVIAGLQSTTPWKAVDLDLVFGTPKIGADQENVPSRFLEKGSELTSPEKRMTVEEWIYYNAGQAEQKLKHECERLVSRFETEGTRAMTVLEGLIVNE